MRVVHEAAGAGRKAPETETVVSLDNDYGAEEGLAAPAVALPLGEAVLHADFHRIGADLAIQTAEGSLLLPGYFAAPVPLDLVTADGGLLPADLVSALARANAPLQLAQSGAVDFGSGRPIGEVVELSGEASVVRADGVREPLSKGDPIFMGDLVETGPGSQLGMTFEDGTAFSLSANGRMVIDELIYDPGGDTNSMTASVLSGTFGFVAGQVASLSDGEGMTVRTPVATIGIRGTTVSGIVDQGILTLLPDPGVETAGIAVITNYGGTQTLDEPYESTNLISFFEPPSLPFALSPQEALQIYSTVLPTLRALLDAGGFGEEGEGQGEQEGFLDDQQFADLAEALGRLEPGAGGPGSDAPGTVGQPTYSVVQVEAVVVQAVLTTLRLSGVLGNEDGRADGFGGGSDDLGGLTTVQAGTVTVTSLAALDAAAETVAALSSIQGTDGDDVITGTAGNDLIDGKGGDDQVFGGAGDDVIVASPGSDVIDGGPGSDSVTFDGAKADHSFYLGDLLVVGPGGTRTLVKNVETLIFTDTSVPRSQAEAEAAPLALVEVDATTVQEGGSFQVTVTLTKASAAPISIDYALTGGTAGTATDLDGESSDPLTGTLTFAPSETEKTLTFVTSQDNAVEADETLSFALTGPTDGSVLLTTELGGQIETAADTTLAETFTIADDDVNVAPSAIALDNATVAENDPGAVVGTLTVTDANPLDTHTLSVDDEDFEIDGNTLKLADGVSLDYEATGTEAGYTVDVTVTAVDSGGLATSQTFTIAATDVAESSDTFRWTGDAGTSAFSTAGNWRNDLLPVDGGTIRIPASGAAVYDGSGYGGGALTASGGSINGGLEVAGGTLAFSGGSTLQLSDGDNNGNLAVAGGTLAVAMDTNGGAIEVRNGGTLRLDGATLSGTELTNRAGGRLEIQGTSTLTQSAPFANQGTLALVAAGAAFVLSEATFTNAAGATVSGTGTIDAASVTNAGTIGPGESIGVVRIDGAFVQSSAGTLALEIDADAADRVAVLGGASLDGALALSAFGAGPDIGDTGVLVAATDGFGAGVQVSDLFAGVTTDGFAVRLNLVPDGATVDDGTAEPPTADAVQYTILGGTTLQGTADADIVVGTAAAERLDGLAGDDLLFGAGGADSLYGGSGSDSLYGGEGNDLLVAGDAEATSLTIDAGNATATTGYTVSAFAPDGESATLFLDTEDGEIGVAGAAGDSDEQLGYDEDREASERIVVDLDDAAIRASVDISFFFADHGERGTWTAENGATGQSLSVDFDADPDSSEMTLEIDPGFFFDRLIFEARARDTSAGDSGLSGSEYYIDAIRISDFPTDPSANLLFGEAGADSLVGSAGDDRLVGGPGADVLQGDLGADTFYFAGPGDGAATGTNVSADLLLKDTIADFAPGQDILELGAAFGFADSPRSADGTFVKIAGTYDGTNAAGEGSSPYDQASDPESEPQSVLIVDDGGNVIHDDNGSQDGYTVVANIGTDAAATISDSDVQVQAASG